MATRKTTPGEESLARLSTDAVRSFAARLRGDVLLPSDAAYEEGRRVWNGMIDRYPAIIARPTGVADVVAAVNFAREQGLEVTVRSGGHNVAGTATSQG